MRASVARYLLLLVILASNCFFLGHAQDDATEDFDTPSDEDPSRHAVGIDMDGDGSIDGYDYDGDGKIDDIEPESGFGKVDDDDGYEWPTIFEAADDMLDVSLLMYPIAQLRKRAKETPEVFKDAAAVLKEPITAKEIGAMLMENRGILVEELQESKTQVLEQVLDAIVERQKKAMDDGNTKRQVTATLVNFADDNTQSELVYAVGVDNARRRVTVAFRGSVTNKDFAQDAQIWMEKIDNPLAGIKGQPKTIRIHHGFYEYMYYNTTSGETRADGVTPKSKYERILDQAKVLLKKYPDYRLYVAGHSLGAALASVFAFMASTDEEVPGPVTCVSVASPFVGGVNFRKAFQYQEKEGRLRYLRIVNHGDIVTIMPFYAINLGSYKHVGVELKLYGDKYTLRYPKGSQGNALVRTWSTSVFNNLSTQYLVNHSPGEYDIRLEVTKEDLSSMYLNDLYQDAKHVGRSIAKKAKKGES